MKSGTHRLPTSDPHDDWVDGSWTVDCVCGVNFDDGEEMVNCDECGVWVHTRCSRYVKSDKSFACDKCKSKNAASIRNESEETEVAQFLVELPTKTLRMDTPASISSRRPFRLWTDIPMEERVHVQGVPGGDPGLFSGAKMSPAFGPQLWKATGYVPKKFNFQYREFPCWDDDVQEEKEDGVHTKGDDQNGNQVDDSAGVLYSLSKEKENTLPAPLVDSIGVKSPVEGKPHGLLSSKQMKERSLVQPSAADFGKHEKEELETSKDQHSKKTAEDTEKEGNCKKRAVLSSQAASTFSSDGKQLEFSEDRNSRAFDVDTQGSKSILGNQLSNILCDISTNITSREQASSRNDSLHGEMPSKDGGYQVLARSDISSETNVDVASLVEHHDCRSNPVKQEVVVRDLESLGDIRGVGTGSIGIGLHDNKPIAEDNAQCSNIEIANSLQPDKKLKAEVDVDNHGCFNVRALSPDDFKLDSRRAAAQHPESSADLLSENDKVTDSSTIGPEASNHHVPDGDRMLDVCNSKDKTNQLQSDNYQSKQEPTGSKGSLGTRQRSSGQKHSLKLVADSSNKSSGSVTNHSTTSYKRKVVVSVGKSPSTSASVTISKFSDMHMPAANQNQHTGSRQKGISDSKVRSVKDTALTNVVMEEEKSTRPKKVSKEPPRSLTFASKMSQPAKSLDALDSKRAPSDSKDSWIHASIKEPSVSHVSATPGSAECASSQQTEVVSDVQNKATDSALPLKGEKINQSGSQSSSRGNASLLHAQTSSSISTLLSDEEYALLLHQELNSSPRVPRVPRMRHAGSLPQLTSTTATSMLMKRTSSSGGKDHGLVFRKKTKDFAKDNSHGSREFDNEAKRPSSRDNRRRDPGYSPDSVSKREADGGSVKGIHSMKTSNSAVSTANVNSSLISTDVANGHNLSSIRNSPRNISQEDQEMVGRPTNRTLPGLIAEIMSKGKRMTYEELCNAVVPHWPHLRKHNGERYAYSSHSQAVLDCLRNRSEWARLVDRGPKTSASRKRRKVDTDSASIESEDNDDNRDGNAKDVGSKSFESNQEDFPKGKRKARKRRRLALQGKGIVRRHRADVVSDDESESFSNTSEDSMSSEEEIQGRGTSLAGNEASSSSDEVR